MAKHKSEVQPRTGRHAQLVLMDGEHPVQAEGDMYLACHAVVATYIWRDIEERLLVESAVGVLRPAVLVAVEDIESFHRTATDGPADVWPCFLQPPAAVGENSSAAYAYITARFEDIAAVGRCIRHSGYEAFKARTQMFP